MEEPLPESDFFGPAATSVPDGCAPPEDCVSPGCVVSLGPVDVEDPLVVVLVVPAEELVEPVEPEEPDAPAVELPDVDDAPAALDCEPLGRGALLECGAVVGFGAAVVGRGAGFVVGFGVGFVVGFGLGEGFGAGDTGRTDGALPAPQRNPMLLPWGAGWE